MKFKFNTRKAWIEAREYLLRAEAPHSYHDHEVTITLVPYGDLPIDVGISAKMQELWEDDGNSNVDAVLANIKRN